MYSERAGYGRLGRKLMYLVSSTINFSVGLLSKVRPLPSQFQQKSNVHDYTKFISGRDYIFELIDGEMKGYLTGQGKGIERGDIILLPEGSGFSQYQVEQIDYYSNLPDMWLALLKKV